MADVPIAGNEGIQWISETQLSKDDLSLIGSHQNAVQGFLAGRDPDGAGLASYAGRSVNGIPLITDLDRILELDNDDLLTFEQFYESR
jgi:hypothetical protein